MKRMRMEEMGGGGDLRRIMEIFCLFCWRALQNPLFKESFINFEVNEVMERLHFL